MKRKYDAERARANIAKKHATKVSFSTGFRTRVRGTPAQIGQKFPILGSRALPKPHYRKPLRRGINPLTPLEMDTVHAEQRLIAGGFKGYTIGIKLKSGEIDEIPLIAKSWHEAFGAAQRQMQKYDPEDIDEVTIVDPSLKEIAHAIGGGARRFAGAIKRGIEKIPRYAKKVEKLGLRAARKLGRIAAQPAQMREAFAAAKAERPWLSEEQFAEEKGVPPKTVKEWREAPTPSVYMPERAAPRAVEEAPEYTPYERKLLSAETKETLKREAEIRAAPRAERPRLNGRAWKPFGVPLLDYQSRISSEHTAEKEAQPSRIGAARRKAAWTERAPVKIER